MARARLTKYSSIGMPWEGEDTGGAASKVVAEEKRRKTRILKTGGVHREPALTEMEQKDKGKEEKKEDEKAKKTEKQRRRKTDSATIP